VNAAENPPVGSPADFLGNWTLSMRAVEFELAGDDFSDSFICFGCARGNTATIPHDILSDRTDPAFSGLIGGCHV